MLSKWRLYPSSLVAVAIALPLASLLGSAAVLGSEWQHFGVQAGSLIVLVAAWLVVIAGAPVALLIGAPLYALLAGNGYARWWSVLLVAVLPSLLVALLEPSVGAAAMLFGTITALLTHLLHRHTRLGRWGLGATTRATAPPA